MDAHMDDDHMATFMDAGTELQALFETLACQQEAEAANAALDYATQAVWAFFASAEATPTHVHVVRGRLRDFQHRVRAAAKLCRNNFALTETPAKTTMTTTTTTTTTTARTTTMLDLELWLEEDTVELPPRTRCAVDAIHWAEQRLTHFLAAPSLSRDMLGCVLQRVTAFVLAMRDAFRQ